MIDHPELLAIAAVAMMAIVVLWANPGRSINRLFCSAALHVATWMTCVHVAVRNAIDPVWVRSACAIGALIPVHMWFLKEASIGETSPAQRSRWRQALWFAVGLGLAGLAITKTFVWREPGYSAPEFGAPYFAFMIVFAGMFVALWRETLRDIRSQSGVVRLELRILLFGGSAAALAIVLLMALHALLHALWPIQLQPFIILGFYSATAVAITTHRIFDARQLVLAITQKVILVGAAVVSALIVRWAFIALGTAEPVAFVIAITFALLVVSQLSHLIDRIFAFYPDPGEVRQAIYHAARKNQLDQLNSAVCSVLKGWGKTERALILSGVRGSATGNAAGLRDDDRIVAAMRDLRWVTPERLTRERVDSKREEVGRFIREHELGVLTLAEGPSLSVLVGMGIGASRQPVTYPQVLQLVELASIIESAFERAHLSTKAQHAEQLATVGLLGASLAHEIRNPLVTIKTFVQLLPAHYQDPAFRNKFFRLMVDEVDRMDRLTEQLLDMASPRTYSASDVELHPVLRASIELVAAKAAHRNVQIVPDFAANPDRVYTDAAAAKQVVLNLCLNAIQAVDAKEDGPRTIWINTRNVGSSVEVAVTDSGPGIAPEMLPRLFQPFQTTKSSGFGLGLAICSDILANLDASITADPPIPERGATFRVTFPCQAS